MIINKKNNINGEINVAPDKSISHRSIILSSLANGTSIITNFLFAEDCLSTIDCFRQMGVPIKTDGSTVTVSGVGLHGLKKPEKPLYTGNSGTTTRLLSGIMAAQEFVSVIDGDSSIRKRPMSRVINPLKLMGANIESNNNYCPITFNPAKLNGIEYTLPIPSAQLKSCILLAGLYGDSALTINEPVLSRNHTENMLKAFKADINVFNNQIILNPKTSSLTACNINVCNDISSAAFFIVLALITKNSKIKILNVGLNETRTGIIDVLKKMGGNITIENFKEGSEPCGDIVAQSSNLKGVTISGDIIPKLIDEIPIIAVAAAFAQGITTIKDAQELKIKESNRIDAMVNQLKKTGLNITATSDGMIIEGNNELNGAEFDTYDDHRIAMSLAICALACNGDSKINNSEVVNISYPEFFSTLESLY